MACYYPVTIPHPKFGTPLVVACGQCIGCRLERSRQWAVRIMHENKLHDDSCFITLTYKDDKLPPNRSLVKRDCQLFIKRLRKAISPKKISYFLCGEYGTNTDRPHYHVILFGYSFPDLKVYRNTDRGDKLYESVMLSKLWGNGFAPVGSVTFESAGYVARYCVDKLTGDAGRQAYEARGRIAPFVLMSTKPAIGKRWYEKFSGDVFPYDEVIANGHPSRPPRYYDKLLEKDDESLFMSIKRRRLADAESREADNTRERLAVKHDVKLQNLKKLKKII